MLRRSLVHHRRWALDVGRWGRGGVGRSTLAVGRWMLAAKTDGLLPEKLLIHLLCHRLERDVPQARGYSRSTTCQLPDRCFQLLEIHRLCEMRVKSCLFAFGHVLLHSIAGESQRRRFTTSSDAFQRLASSSTLRRSICTSACIERGTSSLASHKFNVANTGVSGVRSSCESIARNWSFALLAFSAVSFASWRARCASLCSEKSRNTSTAP